MPSIGSPPNPPGLPSEGDQISAALASAQKLGLVLRGADCHRFAQGMIGELLCDEVSATRRAELRRRLETEPSAAVPLVVPPVRVEPAPSRPLAFRKEGEFWTLSFAGRTCRVKDVKGLAFVAFLLRHPGKPLHVTELVDLEGGRAESGEAQTAPAGESTAVRKDLGDAGVVLDDQAKSDYRRRLDDLRTELEEATNFHDTGRAERLREEIDFLTHELAAAIGLGGRNRRVGSHTERARVNVTRSITRAIEKLGEIHPELADHLDRAIRTGTFCTYAPDASLTDAWEL